MTIQRVINGEEIKIELTKDELRRATRELFAQQNEEFIRSFVDEDKEFAQWSEEEKEEMIRDIAWQMVSYVQIEGDELERKLWELAEEYRNKDFDDDCDDDDDDSEDEE